MLAVGVVLLGAQLFKPRDVERFRDERGVSGGDRVTAISLINVHESSPHYLRVFGERYDNVRGLSPFYQYVPEIDSMFFVIEEEDHDDFVFISLKDRHVSRINVGRTAVGFWLASRSGNSAFADGVTVESPEVVTVFHRGTQRTDYIQVDLRDARVISKWEAVNKSEPSPGG